MTKLLLALAMVFSILALPAPAQAGECSLNGTICGNIYHYAPDANYDPPIIITCTWPNKTMHFLAEGQRSTRYCKDSDGLYIRSGEELWCYMPQLYWPGIYKWKKRFDKTGWHKTDDIWSDGAGCTLRRD